MSALDDPRASSCVSTEPPPTDAAAHAADAFAATLAAALLQTTELHSGQTYPFPLESWWHARDQAPQPAPSSASPPLGALPTLSADECLQRLLYRQFTMAMSRGLVAESAEQDDDDAEMRNVATSAYMQLMQARRTIREQAETIEKQSDIIRKLTRQAQATASTDLSQDEALKMKTSAASSSPALSVSVAAAAAAAPAPCSAVCSAPAISLALVQRFLLLPEVARSMRVSRVWSVAALDPLVWAHRDTSAHLAHSRRLGFCSQCSPGGSCDRSGLSVPEQAWAESRLLTRCPSVHWARSHPMPADEALDGFLAMLPRLSAVRFERHCSAPELAATLAHQLFRHLAQLDFIVDQRIAASPAAHAAPGTRVLPDPSKHRAWRTLMSALARSCPSLRHLTLRLHESAVMLAPDLAVLCDQLPDLHSLAVWSGTWCLPDLPRPMLELQSLRCDFTVEQVERVCAQPAWLPRLHTVDLIIAATVAVDADDECQLDPTRLACLAALPSLLHLSLRLPSCALDPLLLLRAAQRRDISAFQRLLSFTCVAAGGFGGWSCQDDPSAASASPCAEDEQGASCTEETADGLDDVRTAAAAAARTRPPEVLRPFPNLGFVYLSCCHSRLLIDEWRLAGLLAAIPNVHTCALRLHSSRAPVEFSLAWCESPAVQSLHQLRSLIVDLSAEVTLASVRAPMLPQLHALARLPNLMSFELVDVLRLSRAELQDLMTLRPTMTAHDDAAPRATENASRAAARTEGKEIRTTQTPRPALLPH